MKIGIDARFYGPQDKGLGRYSQKLIENLEKLDGDSERQYVVFLKKRDFADYQPQKSNFRKVLADYPWYSWSEQVLFPFRLYREKLDLVHFCHFNVPALYWKRMMVTIHDLILFHYPTVRNTTLNRVFYFFKLLAYWLVINWAVFRAQKIIAVSDFTKEDILSNFKHAAGKTFTTQEGCDRPKINEFKDWEKYAIIKPYLLYVGNAYPHKNLERLCYSFQKIKEKHFDLSLVLVGGKDFFYQRLEKEIKKNNWQGIVLAGFVADVDLGAVYQNAEIFVMPSLYEGVGLPPLEALACGTPVVSSSRTSLPEFLAEAAVYFDPEKEAEMREKILEVLDDNNLQKEIVEKGQERLKLFSWEKMAKKTLEIYQELDFGKIK